MTRDISSKAKKQRWADWLNAKLAERGWNAADLVKASGDALIYGTVQNWVKAITRIEAETVLVVAALLDADPSEALEAASYPLFAAALAGRELRIPGLPNPDPGVRHILGQKDLPDEVKASMISWWKRRLADDEARRLDDMKKLTEWSERDTA